MSSLEPLTSLLTTTRLQHLHIGKTVNTSNDGNSTTELLLQSKNKVRKEEGDRVMDHQVAKTLGNLYEYKFKPKLSNMAYVQLA